MSLKLASSFSPFTARSANPILRNFYRCNSVLATGKGISRAEELKFRDQRRADIRSETAAQDKSQDQKIRSFERNQTRDWKVGDVYSPHDISQEEMKKWRQRKSPATDIFDALAMDPLDHYKNFSIMSEYMSEMGRIKPITETGLRPVNQRKMAKAIRRAVGLGLMPSVYRHPEILMLEHKL